MDSGPFRAKPQVRAEHYLPSRYLSPGRMASIAYQVRLLARHFPNASVLEIGAGSGLASQLLREEGFDVTVADLDPALKPDVAAALPHLPLRDGAVGATLCCQVLEHMPFAVAKEALREIRRISRQGAVISIPTVQPGVALAIFGRGRDGNRVWSLPSFRPGEMIAKGEHHWEIGANLSLAAFRRAIVEAGFDEAASFRPAANMYHHFFVLKAR